MATTFAFGLAACGDGGSSTATTSEADDVAAGAEEEAEVNPCSPEAPAEETALEGEPAAPGAPITDVVAVDYAFEGVPETLPSGEHGFTLSGTGDEFHELALVRVDDDRPVEEIFDLPESEQEAISEYLGGITACPGETSAEPLGASLEPGRYVLVCFVPVGTTPDLRGDALPAAYENPPHFTEGMVAELTVE
ncbi:MAG: hypothetical protein H0W25_11890 [Acidimicrobiia bacterium]|nr:hypothetical protein [Acidimicrobiia bacterium]